LVGIDLSKFLSVKTKKPSIPTITLIGRLAHGKGHEYFLKAAKEIVKKHKAQFLIVGDGELREEIEQMITQNGLKKHVKMLGHRNDVPQIMASSSMIVIPSLWEGTPRVIPEAFAMKKPVIATPVGGIPDIISDGKTGILVEPRNSHQLAAKINDLIENPKKAQRMAEQAHKSVKEFSADTMVRQIDSQYKHMIAPLFKPIRVAHIITKLALGGAQENTAASAAYMNSLPDYYSEIIAGPVRIKHDGSVEPLVRIQGTNIQRCNGLTNNLKPFIMLYSLFWLASYLKRKKFTIVHTHSSVAGIMGRLAAKIAGTKIIVHTIHGWGLRKDLTEPKKSLYILLERLCSSFTHKLIAVSKFNITKGLRYKIGRRKQYTVIHSGIGNLFV